MDNRIAGVVGDPALFSIAENNAKSEIEELGADAMVTRIRWDGNHEKSITLSPSIIPNTIKLYLLYNPPSPSITKMTKASDDMPNTFLVFLIDADDFDRRSKTLRELEDDGSLHVAGYVRPYEHARWNSLMNVIASSEGLNLSSVAISELRKLEYTKNRSVRLKSGRFAERLTCDFQKVKREAIKAQMYAGFDQEVTATDVKAVCIPDFSAEPWDLVDAMMSGDIIETIRCVDALATGIADVRRILGLIRSQLELIVSTRAVVEETSLKQSKDIAAAVRDVRTDDHYDMWDGGKSKNQPPPVNSFRIDKILDLKTKPIWDNCHMGLRLCLDAYEDLIGPLASNWYPVIMRFCIDVSTLSANRV